MVVQPVELESQPPLTVAELETLAAQQDWDADSRVELLDGEVVWGNPVNDPHIGWMNRLTRLFSRRYPEGAVLVSVQNPVRVGLHEEPEPSLRRSSS